MRKVRKIGSRSEEGIALLIAIFVLLLVSVVAIALLVSSGTETALGANYRSSSTVYYAAMAGLEEARGRLLAKNPSYFGTSVIPTPMPLGRAVYVVNRLPGEDIRPWDSTNPYYDAEYQSEFGVPPSSWQSVYSVWDNNVQGIPGPAYKWVRINAVTDTSLFTEIDYSTGYHPGTAVYYDPAHLDYNGDSWPSMVVGSTATAKQVLEITSLATLPNGSKKILQYLVTSIDQNLSFPAALTFDGPNVGHNLIDPGINMPYSADFIIDAFDQDYYPNAGSCALGSNPSPQPMRAIGYSTNDGSQATINTAIFNGTGYNDGDFVGNSTGVSPPTPNVAYVGYPAPPGPPTLSANLQTLSGVNSVVTSLSQLADVNLTGPVTQSDSNNLMPAAMSATNPMTVIVNGDFTENGWSGTGYGILLVTGTFTYDPNSSWNGIILVIGKGVFTSTVGYPGSGRINGAVLVAATVNASGTPLPSLGSPTFDFTGYGSQGIYYSSCWIQAVQTASRYRVLSFHEIPQS